jgi:DNA (cytosine-5)-methyltransferase 1
MDVENRATMSEDIRTSAPDAPKPVFIDVFAGCGGLSLGLKRAGWGGLFAIEKDAFAFETLDANFPAGGALSYGWPETIERRAWDIHELLANRRDALEAFEGEVDLLAGGPPCQGFSEAGRRRHDDPRNRLFEDYLTLVGIIRPRLVLIENVRGFQTDFSAPKGGEIKNFAAALRARLEAEYHTTSAVIRASEFGVPQSRPRFFLVGARRDSVPVSKLESFFQVLADRRAIFLSRRGLPRSPSARDAISDLEVSRNGTIPCSECVGFESIGYVEPRTQFQEVMRDGYDGIPPDTRLARHRPDIRERFKAIIRACQDEGRLNTTISAEVRKAHGLKKIAIRVLDPLSAAPTITSLPDDLLHYSEPRTLSVRENARLQTFPDWFAFKGKYTTGGDRRRREVPRFTQVANAVPPLLAEQIGLVLLELCGTSDHVEVGVKCTANTFERSVMRPQLRAEFDHPSIINNNGGAPPLD